MYKVKTRQMHSCHLQITLIHDYSKLLIYNFISPRVDSSKNTKNYKTKSLIYKRNNNGPSTYPCGTPTVKRSESQYNYDTKLRLIVINMLTTVNSNLPRAMGD